VLYLFSAIVEYFNKHIGFVKEHEKKRIVVDIIATIRNSGGRFLNWSKERHAFYEINAEATETKVSRALKYRKLRDSQSLSSKTSNDSFKRRMNDLQKPKKYMSDTVKRQCPLLGGDLHKPKTSMSDTAKRQGSLLGGDSILGTTVKDQAASKDHDTLPQMPLGGAKKVSLPSELQSMHYKKLIEQRQPEGLLPLFHRNISNELRRAYEEIDLLQAELKVHNHQKIKLQKKIKKMMRQQSSQRHCIITTL
jgi:hypothetical protein